ncbi:MAG: three-Cys-motif partner protein TcmP [Anaerolineaceae bacterium]
MTKQKYRSTQTHVKHEILSKYLDTWGGIILSGLQKSETKYQRRFVYVDCCASSGKYQGDKEDEYKHDSKIGPVYGSPIIGLNALDKLMEHSNKRDITNVYVNSILVEQNQKCYQELKNTLIECGYESRIKETIDFASLQNGEIALVNADVTQIGDELIRFTNIKGTWAFYLLDPYGPKAIPFPFVKKIIECEHHDVMINLIYEDLVRKTGMAPNTNLSQKHKQLVEYWIEAYSKVVWDQHVVPCISKMEDLHEFNIESYMELGAFSISDSEDSEMKIDITREEVLSDAYKIALQTMDPKIVVKLIALKFPDKERTMLYLFLTTHDPTGALELNKILSNAKLLEYQLKSRLSTLKKIPQGQMSLWNLVDDISKVEQSERPTTQSIANEIYEMFAGNSSTRRQIYASLIDTDYFPSEINKALNLLCSQGKANYDGKLTHNSKIKFLR